MNNIVKLIFNCISTGSGWADLKKNAAESLKNMNQLGGAMKSIAINAGAMGGAIGNALSAFLTGNIWGLATEGAKLLIDKLGIFKDRSAETKEKLEKLEESTRKFYETINSNSQKSLAKIDAETKKRNEQLDITNRMIKAELQLQKARAIASGDAQQAERIDRQITEADQTTAMQKAKNAADAQARRASEEESRLADKLAAEYKARRELEQAEEALKSASKPITSVMQSSAGAFVHTKYRDTSSEKAAVEAARKKLEVAKAESAASREAFVEERRKHQLALDNVKALELEQRAAAEQASAAKAAAEIKEQKRAIDERSKADKEAREKFAEEERKRKEKLANDERERQREELREEERKRNEQRKKALQKDIEANRQRAASLEQALGEAMDRVRETRDVLGNAAGMDQAGDLSDKRRAALTDDRYTNASIDLVAGGKIRKGADGKWESAGGRLSNFNKAILDRMNAEHNMRNVKDEQDKVVNKLDELIRKFEQLTSL